MAFAELALAAWALEIAFGWPGWLFDRVRHPVVWIGAAVDALDVRYNDARFRAPARRALGALSTGIVVGGATALAGLVSHALPAGGAGAGLEALIASSLLAFASS